MKRALLGAAALGLFGIFLGCASAPVSSSVEPGWISNMHKLSAAHLKLIPLASDPRKFSDPARREEIRDSLKQMVDATTAIVNDNKAPNADPIIQFTAAGLANEVKQAYTALDMNDLQWSRFSIHRTSSYCISCHTRADRGVKDFATGLPAELSTLNPTQAVEFLIANRRYKSALAEAMKLAAEKEQVQKDPRTWILAIEKALGLVIRVNNEPAQAEKLAQLVAKNKAAPTYLRRDAAAWLRDIQIWRKEDFQSRRPVDIKSVAKIVDRAQKSGPHNPASLIQYLRASGLTHELLETVKPAAYGEALLYAGIAAGSLRDLNMGFLDQYYLESCINHEPHTELAERCYSRLEATVRESNPFLESDPGNEWATASRLDAFRKLAEVKDALDDPHWNRLMWEEFDKFQKQDAKEGHR